jgi:secreted trypsin-like serine protease
MRGKTTLLAMPILLSLVACGVNKSQTTAAMTSAENASGIVGGVAVAKEDPIAKHIIALEHPWYGVYCSGILIKKNVVLTAAHCTGVAADPRQINVVFGNDLNGPLQKRAVLGGKTTDKWPNLTIAEQNDLKAQWGDIALLKFAGEAPVGFEPARILNNPERLVAGMDVVLAGYGLTAMPDSDPMKLMKATVKLTDPKFTPSEIQFNQHDGKGACHGDSGGPAFATINGKLFLIGVTSRSATHAGGNTCLEGSVYTNVATQINFLVATARFLDSPDFVPGQAIPQPREN